MMVILTNENRSILLSFTLFCTYDRVHVWLLIGGDVQLSRIDSVDSIRSIVRR